MQSTIFSYDVGFLRTVLMMVEGRRKRHRDRSGAAFSCCLRAGFRLMTAAIVFLIARNHLIDMTYGKMSLAPAAHLPKTNHTGLLSEAKADCLGKSTSSSASD
jgi:hypothetical protein